MEEQNYKDLTIRFPKSIYNQIKEMAVEDDRSFSKQVIHLLKLQLGIKKS